MLWCVIFFDNNHVGEGGGGGSGLLIVLLNWLLLIGFMFHDKYQLEIWKNTAGKPASVRRASLDLVYEMGHFVVLAYLPIQYLDHSMH